MGLDHLVYGVPDLGKAVEEMSERLGVRATLSGRHPGRGTWNALLGLGGGAYLELIAPDPSQPDSEFERRSFGVTVGMRPRMVGWAWQCRGIDEVVRSSRSAGHDPGDVVQKVRETPDGKKISWRMTNRPVTEDNYLTPFLIEWIGQEHPADVAPAGVTLESITVQHPRPTELLAQLHALGVDTQVAAGPQPRLMATLRTVHGVIELE